MLDNEAIKKIIANGENQNVEFKESNILSDSIKLAIEITAMANTSVGGLIFIGVKDNKEFEGMKFKKRHEEHLMNIIRDRIQPPFSSNILYFQIESFPNGDIYILSISPNIPDIYAVKIDRGLSYYTRVGTTVRPLHPHELKQLIAIRTNQNILKIDKKEEKKYYEILDCGYCNGKGEVPLLPRLAILPEPIVTCPICNGNKKIKVSKPYIQCNFCSGRGHRPPLFRLPCPICLGTGWSSQFE